MKIRQFQIDWDLIPQISFLLDTQIQTRTSTPSINHAIWSDSAFIIRNASQSPSLLVDCLPLCRGISRWFTSCVDARVNYNTINRGISSSSLTVDLCFLGQYECLICENIDLYPTIFEFWNISRFFFLGDWRLYTYMSLNWKLLNISLIQWNSDVILHSLSNHLINYHWDANLIIIAEYVIYSMKLWWKPYSYSNMIYKLFIDE